MKRKGSDTLNTYSGLFIFPTSLKDETLDKVLEDIRAEITKHGGDVVRTEVLGKRSFARVMANRDAGLYVRLTFALAPSGVQPLNERLKLSEDIIRAQITLEPKNRPEARVVAVEE